MTLLASDKEISGVAGDLPLAEWRMIASHDMPGDYLMALDEALLESVIAGAPPVVRFYTWQPATLSLGVNQALREIDRQECEQRKFMLVRRLTGGRAVLHQHELTYSVIAREHDPRVSGGVIEFVPQDQRGVSGWLACSGPGCIAGCAQQGYVPRYGRRPALECRRVAG